MRVDTDAGISGWGECYTQSDRDQSIVPHITQLGRYLTGRDPHQIKHFTYTAYHDYAGKRGSMELYSAVSGIEQALWDIIGKEAGQPRRPARAQARKQASKWAGSSAANARPPVGRPSSQRGSAELGRRPEIRGKSKSVPSARRS